MGQACCNYAPKDSNVKNFDGMGLKIGKQGMKYNTDNADLMKAYRSAKDNQAALIKIQAFSRGCLVRKYYGKKKPTASELE